MKKIIASILLAAVALAFTHPDDWVLFETSHYSVQFPKKPTDQTQTIHSAIGDLQLSIHMYEVLDGTTDDNATYAVMETKYPDSLINSDKKDKLDNFFKKSVDGAVSNVQGKLLSVDTVALDGYPGRSFRVDFQNGVAVITMRFYLVKNSMYMLQTIAYTQHDHNAASDRFMNSFTLKH